MVTSRVTKALWPPALGWTPLAAVCAIAGQIAPHGGKFLLAVYVVIVTSLAAAPRCVANVVRIAGWRDMPSRLRYALLAANLSFPLAVGAFILLP
jgi:hypothetical protein